MKLFDVITAVMNEAGLIWEIFTFVDASKMEPKVNIWSEQDRVLAAGHANFDNETPQRRPWTWKPAMARRGRERTSTATSLTTRSTCSPARSTRVAATLGEVTDAAGLACVCPSGGAVYTD